MRLIDADALMADLEKWMKQIDPTHPPEDNAIPPMEDIIVSTLMTIEEQPTIEPQRMKGHWIKKMNVTESNGSTLYNPEWYCSQCKSKYDPIMAQRINFCCVCGSDMRGEQG